MFGVALPPAYLVTLVAGCAFLAAASLFRERRLWGILSLVALAMTAACLVASAPPSDVVKPRAVSIAIDQSRIALFFQWTSLAIGTLFTLTALDTQKSSRFAPEWHGGLLLTVSGMLMASTAGDLATLFVAIELVSMPLAVLVLASSEQARMSREDILKPLMLNLLSSAVLLYGFSLLFAITGTTSLAEIRELLAPTGDAATVNLIPQNSLRDIAFILIFSAVCCRLAIVPFQPALADVCAATAVVEAGFLASASTVVGLIVMVRVLIDALGTSASTGELLAIVLSAASLFVGSALALLETRFKRILAYLVLANAGLVMLAIGAGFADAAHPERSFVASRGLPGGVESSLFHATSYLIASGGLIAAMTYLTRRGSQIEHVEDLSGVAAREPVAAVCAGICLLSLAGIPPMPGFWSRVFVLASGMSVHLDSQRGFLPHPNPAFQLLTVLAVASMVMMAGAYLRIVAAMFLEGQVARPEPAGGQTALAAALLSATLLLGVGFLPGPVLGYLDGILIPPVAVTTAKSSASSNARETRTAPVGENGTGTPAQPAPSAAAPP